MITRDADHVYRDEHGIVLPGVTDVIRAASLSGDAAAFYTEESRTRGSLVHELTRRFDDGADDTELVGRFGPGHLGFLDAWKRFLEDQRAEVVLVEHIVHNKNLRYAGTLDRTLNVPGRKRPVLVDIKTGTVGPWVGLQTAAYAACLPTPHERWAVQLTDAGTYSIKVFDSPTDLPVFIAALTIYHWRLSHHV